MIRIHFDVLIGYLLLLEDGPGALHERAEPAFGMSVYSIGSDVGDIPEYSFSDCSAS